MQSRDIIIAALRSDPTATEEQRKAILAAMNPERTVRTTAKPGTTEQACEILQVHPVTLRRYAKQGLLNPIRHTARRIRWDLNEVERFACEGVSR